MNGILKGCSMILKSVSVSVQPGICSLVIVQLNKDIKEVRPKTLVVKLFSKVLRDLDSLILR